MKHLVTLADLSTADIQHIFAISEDLKSKYNQAIREPLLPGRVATLFFEKPSLRTRVSFEVAMAHLGGSSISLGSEVGIGKRETIEDFARVLSQYADAIIARTFDHSLVEDLAKHATCTVINGLTDFSHPCQALADLFTLKECCGDLQGLTLAYVGDCNNVTRSLVLGCGRMGVNIRIAAPKDYQFSEDEIAWMKQQVPHVNLLITADPVQAVTGAQAVYTDVWASMGQESEVKKRHTNFSGYQIDANLMSHAAGAFFMHCLPAHRGEEVSAEVIDGPQSIVIQQAGNRLHAQKGILAWLLGTQT